MNNLLIVSRHPGAVAWLREEGHVSSDVPVLSSATAADVRGKVVYGNLPLHLAALAVEVRAIEFTGPPPRGQEYGAEEMRAAGAGVRRYRVQASDECY